MLKQLEIFIKSLKSHQYHPANGKFSNLALFTNETLGSTFESYYFEVLTSFN
jgi:hypothetical protein